MLYKKIFKILVISIMVFCIFSCSREWINPYDNENPDNWPEIKTDSIYVNINKVSAIATITKSKSKLTQRGFCWSENTTPTISDVKIDLGFSDNISSFQVNPLGLIYGKSYHFRAFTKNLSQTAYSNEIIFTPNLVYKITDVLITQTNTATVSGFIKGTFLQGLSTAEYGICFATNNSPTTANNTISFGYLNKDSVFNLNVQVLVENPTYYFKIFRKDIIGTTYSDVFQFKVPCPSVITDASGNSYNTVTIGNQCWMHENLKTTKYRDGTNIPNVTNSPNNSAWINLSTGAYCDYSDSPANSNIYGRLYNWYAVVNAKNICPAGWHLPTISEWSQLIDSLGGSDISGGKMKEIGTTYWKTPNTGASNSSNFTALPGGYRWTGSYVNSYSGMYYYGFWWSANAKDSYDAWYRSLSYDNIKIFSSSISKNEGLSVRCVRDQ